MNKITRRQILGNASALFFLEFGIKASAISFPSTRRELHFAAFAEILRVWRETEAVEPEHALQAHGINPYAPSERLRAQCREDFERGRTKIVLGFVLSRTETATIAVLAKRRITHRR